MVRSVLMDVGGTLWPDIWPEGPADFNERVGRLRHLVPPLTGREARDLVAILSPVTHPTGERQQTDVLVADAIATIKPTATVSIAAVTEAMCLPAEGRVRPFAGAQPLLAGLAGRGIRVVIVSNAVWRYSAAYRRDFDSFGWSHFVAGYVSSLNVGWRKPHPAFFGAALAQTGCPPQDCVMVGDSEPNDIAPARARGILTVRACIEERPPVATAADHVCESLSEVAETLFSLANT